MGGTFVNVTSARASDFVGERVKGLRTARGWTAKQLAERCAAIGAPELTAPVIANIETGRRDKDGRRRRQVTIDEAMTLAYALDVPPVYLFVPIDGSEALKVTTEIEMGPFEAVTWAIGASAGVTHDPSEERNRQWAQARRQLNLLRDAWMALTILDAHARRPVSRHERTTAVEQLATIQLGRLDSARLPDSWLTKPGDPISPEIIEHVRRILAYILYELAGFGLTPPPVPAGLTDYEAGELTRQQHFDEAVDAARSLEELVQPAPPLVPPLSPRQKES
jgi:transcriptional regulator with XRE-family HTH domain